MLGAFFKWRMVVQVNGLGNVNTRSRCSLRKFIENNDITFCTLI